MKWPWSKPKVKNDRNPWLDMPHPHDPLPASNGTEMVCGMCGLRESSNALKELTMPKKKIEVEVQEPEVIERKPNVVSRPTDGTVNNRVAPVLPSLDD